MIDMSKPGKPSGISEAHGDHFSEVHVDVEEVLGSATGLKIPKQSSMPVAFQNITYTVVNSAKRRQKVQLLSDAFGCLLPGQLAALMGPSGSGKTTLLDILAGRKTVGRVNGTILFAGHKPTREFLRRYSSYVEQFDTLIPNLTVYEMLMYTIELKLERQIQMEVKRHKVEAVMAQLNLTDCRAVCIGNAENRGISGGQLKRVNVGLALVSNPRVLFLDEPTSGLDSFTANEVLSAVKGLVADNITIVSTIHSPTSYCFSLFDSLTLLLGGRVIYSGPNGEAAMNYFQAFPKLDPIEAHVGSVQQNPAEWIVDLTTKADRMGRRQEFADAFDASEEKKIALAGVERYAMITAEDLTLETQQELAVQRATTNGFFSTLWVLLKYRTWRDLQDMEYIIPRVADKLVFALVLMAVQWKVGSRLELTQVNNQVNLLFMWSVLPAYAAVSFIPNIVQERDLYVRERNDGLYRPITYLCFKFSGEFLVMTLVSLAASAIVFYTVRLAGSYLYFWIAYLVTALTGIALGYAAAASSPNLQIAVIVLPVYCSVLLFFTGLLIRPSDQPAYLHWFSYIAFVHYSWSGMMINQYKDTAHSGAKGYAGLPLLEFFSLKDSNKWAQVGYLSCFGVVFMFFAWLALAYKRMQKR